MKNRQDLEPIEDIEAALSALFHAPRPDPAFTEKLERSLASLGQPVDNRSFWRRGLDGFLAAFSPSLAWGALAVLLVAGLIWSINHLLPASLPVTMQGASDTPAPSQTLQSITSTPNAEAPSGRLSLASSHAEIRARLTDPQWDSIWVEGRASRQGENGNEIEYAQAWLVKAGPGRVVSSGWLPGDTAFSLNLIPDQVWAVPDPRGQVWNLDVQTGETSAQAGGGEWTLHPLEEVSPVLEMIFLPRMLAILSSDVNPIGEEEIGGRPALVVEWGGSRLWADAETGLLLKRQSLPGLSPESETALDQVIYGVKAPEIVFSPDGMEGASFQPAPDPEAAVPDPAATPEAEPRIKVNADVEAVNVRTGPGTEVYPVIGTLAAGDTAQAVGRSPDGEWVLILYPGAPDGTAWVYASYVQVNQGTLPVIDLPEVEVPPTPTPLPVYNAEGEPVRLTLLSEPLPGTANAGGLTFALQSWQDGFTYRMFRVDLPCLLSESACRAAPLPDLQGENYISFSNGLVWARDGKKAVVMDSNNQQLHLYRAGTGQWETIAYQLFISGGVLSWSPNGTYLAGTTQGEDGLSNLVTVIPADGEQEEPAWRVYAAELGGDQTAVGWVDDQTVLFMRAWSPPKGTEGQAEPPSLYTLDVVSGEWRDLDLELGWSKGFPALSPDGSTLVMNMDREGMSGLWFISLENGEANFLGVNGDYLTWSPDGNQIAFSAYENGLHTAYTIGKDGEDLKKLFEWNHPFSIEWSPLGEHLLLQVWPTDTDRTRLYLVSTGDGLAQQILIEGAGADSEPRYPSFQPAYGR